MSSSSDLLPCKLLHVKIKIYNQDIVNKLSKIISELDDIIENMRNYNKKNNDQLVNLNK